MQNYKGAIEVLKQEINAVEHSLVEMRKAQAMQAAHYEAQCTPGNVVVGVDSWAMSIAKVERRRISLYEALDYLYEVEAGARRNAIAEGIEVIDVTEPGDVVRRYRTVEKVETVPAGPVEEAE